MLKVMKYKLKI